MTQLTKTMVAIFPAHLDGPVVKVVVGVMGGRFNCGRRAHLDASTGDPVCVETGLVIILQIWLWPGINIHD